MTNFKQLEADIVGSVLSKCLENISSCHLKLEVKGILSVIVDSHESFEININAACHKAVTEMENSAIESNKIKHCHQDIKGFNHNTNSDSTIDTCSNIVKINPTYHHATTTGPMTSSMSENEDISSYSFQEPDVRVKSVQNIASPVVVNNRSTKYSSNKRKNKPKKSLQFHSDDYEWSTDNQNYTHERKKRPSVKRKQYTSDAIIQASRKVLEENMSIAAAAKLFGIPRTTLRDRLHGHSKRHKLSTEETNTDPMPELEYESETVSASVSESKEGVISGESDKGTDSNTEEQS